MKNPNAIVKRGMLTKEGNKPNRRVESRLMIVKAKTLSWYHDQKEFEQGKKPLGVIYMHAIYHCVPAKGLRQTDDLNVSILANENRSVQAPGGRKTPRRKAGESSRLVLRTSSRETNGSLASNTFELKQSMIISCQSIAT
jgi:hypothetical protein